MSFESGGQYGSIPTANGEAPYGSVPQALALNDGQHEDPTNRKLPAPSRSGPGPGRRGTAPPPGLRPQAPIPSRAEPTSSQYGSVPQPVDDVSTSSAYGSVPTAPNAYGNAPPPVSRDSGGQYGSAPAALKDVSAQYGSAPPALKQEAGGQYGVAPPALRENTSMQYGSAPPPKGDQYGNAPPALAKEPGGQYGQAPTVREESNYGAAPPAAIMAAPAARVKQLDTSFMNESYWKPNWSRVAAETVLLKAPDASGVVRLSTTPNNYCVSYRQGQEVLHTLVEVDTVGVQYVVVDVAGARLLFPNMAEVLTYLGVVPLVEIKPSMPSPVIGPGRAMMTPSRSLQTMPAGRASGLNSSQDTPIFVPQPSRSPEIGRRAAPARAAPVHAQSDAGAGGGGVFGLFSKKVSQADGLNAGRTSPSPPGGRFPPNAGRR